VTNFYQSFSYDIYTFTQVWLSGTSSTTGLAHDCRSLKSTYELLLLQGMPSRSKYRELYCFTACDPSSRKKSRKMSV